MTYYCVSDSLAWLTPVAAAAVIVVGNIRINVVNRRRTAADEHRKHLYGLLTLAAEYWTKTHPDRNDRRLLEARLLAGKLAASSQAIGLRAYSRRLKTWHDRTIQFRLDLMDALTGGCFQQDAWSPDPGRVNNAAKAIAQITTQLTRAS